MGAKEVDGSTTSSGVFFVLLLAFLNVLLDIADDEEGDGEEEGRVSSQRSQRDSEGGRMGSVSRFCKVYKGVGIFRK